MFTRAHRWGQQQALASLGLLKFGWYDPWQVDVARRHYPEFFAGGAADEVAMANLQQAVRARALAPQDPAAARIVPPRQVQPFSSWMPGGRAPVSQEQADFLRRLQSVGEPAPVPLSSLHPADIPAEVPHTPLFREGAFMKNVGTRVSPFSATEVTGRPLFQEAATGAISRKALARAAQLARRVV